MTPLWAAFVFVNLWCVSIFMFLSLGNTNNREQNSLEYKAAPDAPNFKKKFIYAAITSACATALIAAMMHFKLI